MCIFEDCKEYVISDHWIKIFDDCKKGKLPNGIEYDPENNILIQGENEVQLGDDSFENFNKMTEIFKENEGEKDDESICALEWKDVKTKTNKDNIILNYIFELKDEYDLNANDIEYLLSQIQIGMQLKLIDSGDIDMIDGRIEEIRNIEFNPETKRFEFERDYNTSMKEVVEVKENRLVKEIVDYLGRG